jgi:surface protein
MSLQLSYTIAPDAFVNNKYTLYLPVTGTIEDINWVGGPNDKELTHVYDSADGTSYTITIYGTNLVLNNKENISRIYLSSCNIWGDDVVSLEYAFYDCPMFTDLPFNLPLPTGITSVKGMFQNATSFNKNLNQLFDINNTNQVEDFSDMLNGATLFNNEGGELNWNVSSAKNMSGMFQDATSFNVISSFSGSNQVEDFSNMFKGASSFRNGGSSNLTLDTSGAKNMSGMFENATSFDIVLNFFDTRQVTDFSNMFKGASSFTNELNSLTWNTSNATNMSGMFQDAVNFNNGINNDPLNFDTSNVTDMSNMFQGATSFNSSLNSLNFSSPYKVEDFSNMFNGATNFNNNGEALVWNTSNAKNMSGMFQNAEVFNVTLAFNVPSVTNFSNMFRGATLFDNGGILFTSFNPNNATNMSGMFQNASSFNKELINFDTRSVTNMSNMFLGATSFNQDLSNLDVSKVTDFSNMFNGASAFNNGDTENNGSKPLDWSINTESSVNMSSMFENASSFNQVLNVDPNDPPQLSALPEIPNTTWNTRSVTDMSNMFLGAASFNQDLSNLDVSSVTDFSDMFYGAYSFNNRDNRLEWTTTSAINMSGMFQNAESFNRVLYNWDVSKVENFSNMFSGAYNFNNDNTPLVWTTSSATNMSGMFQGAVALTIFLDFDTSKVENFSNMFNGALNFNNGEEGNGTSQVTDFSDNRLEWNTSSAINMSGMFQNTYSFNRYLYNWDVNKVTDFSNMFNRAYAFNNGDTGPNGNHPLEWSINTTENVTMSSMFQNAIMFDQQLREWDTSSVTNMNSMFLGAIAFNQGLSNLNVNNVTDFTSMFNGAYAFNNGYSGNDIISSLGWTFNSTNDVVMSNMFANTKSFNQTLPWDVSFVTLFDSMFNGAEKFNNGDTGNNGNIPLVWTINTNKNVDMNGMFQNAVAFNQNIDSLLTTGTVFDFSNMFNGAEKFNNGYTRNISFPMSLSLPMTHIYMERMFTNAKLFNQDISLWQYENCEFDDFVSYSGLNITNYTKLLEKLADTNFAFISPDPDNTSDFNGSLKICSNESLYTQLESKGFIFDNNIYCDEIEVGKVTFTVNNTNNPIKLNGRPIDNNTFEITVRVGLNRFLLADDNEFILNVIFLKGPIYDIPSDDVDKIGYADTLLDDYLEDGETAQFDSSFNTALGVPESLSITCYSRSINSIPIVGGNSYCTLKNPQSFTCSSEQKTFSSSNGELFIDGIEYFVGDIFKFCEFNVKVLTIGSVLFNAQLPVPPTPTPPVPPSPIPLPIFPICFPAGTPITTDQGIFPIEILTTQTMKGYPIEITKTISPDSYLVCFEKHALSHNIPSKRTIISKDHVVYFGHDKSKAKDYVGRYKGVYKIKYHGEPLYNVLLPIHSTMTVNLMKCETLNPHHIIAKIHKKCGKEQAYILSVLDRLIKQKKFNEYRYAVSKL